MQVKFFVDYTVKAVDGMTYKAGEAYDLNESSANHFVNRGVAEKVTGTAPVAAPAANDDKPDEEASEEVKPKRLKRSTGRG